MANYVISTDSTADLSIEYISENGILLQDLGFNFGDEVYHGLQDMEILTFYNRMREGGVATTNASIPEKVIESFESALQKGFDILHLGFSSGLSGSYQSAVIAANELKEKYPDRKIIVLDTLAATLGQGMVVCDAVDNKNAGMSLEENAAFCEKWIPHICHEFTVEDLKYLSRGGRISKTTAVLGTMMNVKPVLFVDDEGHLINRGKVRGRKQSLNALVDNMGTHLCDEFKNKTIYIAHADCLEDAQYVASRIKEKFGFEKFHFGYICPTIGAHTGPGCVALCFYGRERKPVDTEA